MLIVLPLGLFTTATAFDAVAAATRRTTLATVGFWNVGAGLIGALAAAPFGLWDWLAIPEGTRARRIGLWHGGGNLAVVGLFGASWLLRRSRPSPDPSGLPLALEVAAATLAMVSGWLGGELVDRLGIGVDEGAHPDAPSSLSGDPAQEPAASDGQPEPGEGRADGAPRPGQAGYAGTSNVYASPRAT
jgi:uncharacterized membrane protein